MTKQELIALLADYPDDAEVMAYDPITDTYEPIIEASDAKFYNGFDMAVLLGTEG